MATKDARWNGLCLKFTRSGLLKYVSLEKYLYGIASNSNNGSRR
jgi:hypothetical protein